MIKRKEILCNKQSSESGVTLMLSILVLAAILSIAFSLATVTFVEIRSSGDLVRTEPTFYAADSLSEEALFKIKRNISDSSFTYDSGIGNVILTAQSSSVATAIFRTVVKKSSYDFVSTKSRFPIYDTRCPAPSSDSALPSNCLTGGSGYGRIKITFLDTGNNDTLKAFLCEFDPQKPINSASVDGSAYTNVPCSNPNDTTNGYWLTPPGGDSVTSFGTNNTRESGAGSWSAIRADFQQELILYNYGSTADIYVQIETFDSSNQPKGLPLVGSTAVDISASSAGMIRKIRTTIPVSASTGSAGTATGYSYHRDITIDHTKVPNTDLADFPVLISWSDNTLRNSGPGHVTSSSGYDIVFTDSGGNPLSFEQESYDGSSGTIRYWVKVPVLSHTSDTTIKMWYGNSAVTSDQSDKNGVWDSNYKGVWHMTENPAGSAPQFQDSTSNNNHQTRSGSANSVAGKIGNSVNFPSSSQWNNNSAISASTIDISGQAVTIQAWVRYATIYANNSSFAGIGSGGYGIQAARLQFSGASNSKAQFHIYQKDVANRTAIGATTLVSNTWHHVVGTYNGSNLLVYVNGVQDGSTGTNISIQQTADFFRSNAVSGQSSNVTLDELRISRVVRSADWIAAEYNNQNSPSTFYSVGIEQ